MPDRYMLESAIASLLDDCVVEMISHPEAAIVMFKDYSFAYIAGSSDPDAVAHVYLKDITYFDIFKRDKEHSMKDDPMLAIGSHMMTDMCAKEILDILLERYNKRR